MFLVNFADLVKFDSPSCARKMFLIFHLQVTSVLSLNRSGFFSQYVEGIYSTLELNLESNRAQSP